MEATVNADAQDEETESKGVNDEKVNNDKVKHEEDKGKEVKLIDVFRFQQCTDTTVGFISRVLLHANTSPNVFNHLRRVRWVLSGMNDRGVQLLSVTKLLPNRPVKTLAHPRSPSNLFDQEQSSSSLSCAQLRCVILTAVGLRLLHV